MNFKHKWGLPSNVFILFNCVLLLCYVQGYRAAEVRSPYTTSSGTDTIRSRDNAVELNENTSRAMNKPRCGFVDKDYNNYKLWDSKWGDKRLTYRILNYPSSLHQDTVIREVRRAFDVWSDVTPLQFFEVQSGIANINIRFTHLYDQKGIVGKTKKPPNGSVELDDSVKWKADDSFSDSHEGVSLLRVAAHEIGHALGLAHTNVKTALMYSEYHITPGPLLHQDDIRGIQELYGARDSHKDKPTHFPDDLPTGSIGVCKNVIAGDNSSVSTVVISEGVQSVYTVVIPGGAIGKYTIVLPGGHSGIYTLKIPGGSQGDYTIVCPGDNAILSISNSIFKLDFAGGSPGLYTVACPLPYPGVYPLFGYSEGSILPGEYPVAYPIDPLVRIPFGYRDIKTVAMETYESGVYRVECPRGSSGSYLIGYIKGFKMVCL